MAGPADELATSGGDRELGIVESEFATVESSILRVDSPLSSLRSSSHTVDLSQVATTSLPSSVFLSEKLKRIVFFAVSTETM